MLSHGKAGIEPGRWAYATLPKHSISKHPLFTTAEALAPTLVIRSSTDGASARRSCLSLNGWDDTVGWSEHQLQIARTFESGSQRVSAPRAAQGHGRHPGADQQPAAGPVDDP